MKYLLSSLVFVSLLSSGIRCEDEMFQGVSFNEDVSRKINLETMGVVEITTEIRFKPKSANEEKEYYFVIPDYLEQNLVSLEAVVSST